MRRKGQPNFLIIFALIFFFTGVPFSLLGFLPILIAIAGFCFAFSIIKKGIQGAARAAREHAEDGNIETTAREVSYEEAAAKQAKTTSASTARAKKGYKIPTVNTGNKKLDTVITEGYQYLSAIYDSNELIEDATISDQLTNINKICENIFEAIIKRPALTDELRKLINYYLPTTLKLLEAYIDFEKVQGSNTKNINDALNNIRETLGYLVTAFEKQYDNLFRNKAMDIETDIDVLKQMLANEGLIGEQMRAERPADDFYVNTRTVAAKKQASEDFSDKTPDEAASAVAQVAAEVKQETAEMLAGDGIVLKLEK